MNLRLVCYWLSALLLVLPARAEIKLDPVFGSNMVLQRGDAILLSGTAATGRHCKVSIRYSPPNPGFLGLRSKSLGRAEVSDSGRWQATLDLKKLSSPCTLTISGGSEEAPCVATNVVLANVWLLADRADQGLSADPIGIATQDPQKLRFLDLTQAQPGQAAGTASPWVIFTGENMAGRFSVLALRLAHQLSSYETKPLGMVLVTTNELAAGLKERKVFNEWQDHCAGFWSNYINQPVFERQKQILLERRDAQAKGIVTNIPWVVEYDPPSVYYITSPSDFPTARLSAVGAIWPRKPSTGE